jgi:hypothetical protein
MRLMPVALVLALGCGPGSRNGQTNGDDSSDVDAALSGDTGPLCWSPLPPAGADVAFAPPFDQLYSVYRLGAVPGVPNPLGGTAILASDHDTLLVAGGSETETGAIYAIGVTRDDCGHITGFSGSAHAIAETPFVDANLVYTSPDLLLYTEWPQYTLSQLPTGATTPGRRDDLRAHGMPAGSDYGPGGLGIVPPSLASAGELRLVTWPGGRWYHAGLTQAGALLDVTSLDQTVTVPNEPGGFAYVPAGSPGFPAQSLIVAEWRRFDRTKDRVAVYEVAPNGDPIVSTRREFLSKFPRPWGAYFEPVTGDYLFLSWGTGNDQIYIVQGFKPPPPVL